MGYLWGDRLLCVISFRCGEDKQRAEGQGYWLPVCVLFSPLIDGNNTVFRCRVTVSSFSAQRSTVFITALLYFGYFSVFQDFVK